MAEPLRNGSFTRSDGAPTGRSFPQFFVESVLDPVASAQQGRNIYRDEERVKIIMPGNQWSQPVERVNSSHIELWPREYEAFKKGMSIVHDGTPLEQWPFLKPATVKELKYLEIHTIEQCAELNDNVVQRLGMGGSNIRAAAKAYLDDAAHQSLITKLQHDNSELEARCASNERQIEELKALLDQLQQRIITAQNTPSGPGSVIPGMLDPVEQNKQGYQPQVAKSSMDEVRAPVLRKREKENVK